MVFFSMPFVSTTTYADMAGIKLSRYLGAISLFDEAYKKVDSVCGTNYSFSEKLRQELDRLTSQKAHLNYAEFNEVYGDPKQTSELLDEALGELILGPNNCDPSMLNFWYESGTRELQRNLEKLRNAETTSIKPKKNKGFLDNTISSGQKLYDSPVAEAVTISGKISLLIQDEQQKVTLGEFVDSPNDLTSANSCSFKISADDEFFNTYPATFQMTKFDDFISYLFTVESKYIDENSKYWKVPITEASIEVAGVKIDNSRWGQTEIKGRFALMELDSEFGLKVFHELTFGQPAYIELKRVKEPFSASIEVAPISSKLSGIARRCMKIIHGDI